MKFHIVSPKQLPLSAKGMPMLNSNLDSFTDEDLVTMAYLNSLPDKTGARPLDGVTWLTDADLPAWQRSIGVAPSPLPKAST